MKTPPDMCARGEHVAYVDHDVCVNCGYEGKTIAICQGPRAFAQGPGYAVTTRIEPASLTLDEVP